MACQTWPLNQSQMQMGTHTSGVPSNGTKAMRIVSPPQSSALGTSSAQYASIASNPCTTGTTSSDTMPGTDPAINQLNQLIG